MSASEPESSYSSLRLAETVTMCIWDLGIDREAEINYITLANTDVLSFMRADYRVPGAGLVSRSCQGLLEVVSAGG